MTRNSSEIIKDIGNALAKVTKDDELVKEYIELHEAWIAHIRKYVDKHIGLAKSANMRSNDNSRDINRLILGKSDVQLINKEIELLKKVNNQQFNLLKEMINRIQELEKPWWKKIICTIGKLKP